MTSAARAPADAGARIVETAPAKVNLDLLVTGRRADGYHELDSLVVFTPGFADWITVEAADGLSLRIDGAADVPTDEGNLVLRAARALAEAAGVRAGARILCEKRIWVAAGLGGGSADAAATLRALDRLWGVRAPFEDLASIGLRVGADVPACLVGRPLRMRGKGERVEPLPPEAAPRLPMILANPGIAVSTAAVFGGLGSFAEARPAAPATWSDPERLIAHLVASTNTLERPAAALVPAIGALIARLARLPGCRLARMTGSGATCFALFDDEAAVEPAIETLHRDRPGWTVVACR